MINRFVVAEANKCIGCRTCEIACAVSHSDGSSERLNSDSFQPRLKVIRGANITVPVLCRQCDNAPCASVCPTGALIRNKGSIQVITERCIGCKTCVIACPFGAMRVIAYDDNKQHQFGNQKPAVAIKCDLCIDNPAGPECVRVCPTKALHIIEAPSLQQLVKDKQRKTALDEINSFLFQ